MKIFYDVDTQKDFMNPKGALPVPDAELIKPNLGMLTYHAITHDIKILGDIDRHFGTKEWKDYEPELKRWGGKFPDHCMDGTEGQKKIPETSVETIFIENTSPLQRIKTYSLEEIDRIINSGKSIVFEKQGHSVFPTDDCHGGNKYIDLFLERLEVTDVVVYGVATDYCVKAAALGMMQRGIQVYLISDAIEAINVNPGDGKKALEEMHRAGIVFINTKDVVGNGRIKL